MENDRTISAIMRNLIKRLDLATVSLILLCFLFFFFGSDHVAGIQTTECLIRSIFVIFYFDLQAAVVTFTVWNTGLVISEAITHVSD